MKADKKNNNKRLVTGVSILLVLLGLNLIVRLSRRTAAPTAVPTATPLPVNVPASEILPGRTTQAPTQQAATPKTSTLPTPVTPGAAVARHDPKLAIQDKLMLLRQRFEEIPEPHEPPDFNLKLELSQFDRFRWQLPTVGDSVVASETQVEVATISKFVQILGSFRVRGRDQLLIQEEDRAYLVDESASLASNTVAFERLNGRTFLVRDSSGATHDLEFAKPVDEGLERAIEVLRGQIAEQPAFEINAEVLRAGEDNQLQTGLKGK